MDGVNSLRKSWPGNLTLPETGSSIQQPVAQNAEPPGELPILIPIITNNSSPIDRMEECVLNGDSQGACDCFCEAKPRMRRQLLQLGCFEKFTKNLVPDSLDEKRIYLLSHTLRKMAAFQVINPKGKDADFLQRLLQLCPSWAMPSILMDLAKQDRIALLQPLVDAHPGLASVLAAVLESHGNSPSAQQLKNHLQLHVVTLGPFQRSNAQDATADDVSALLDKLEQEGDSDAVENMRKDLLAKVEKKFGAYGGAFNMGALHGKFADPDILESVLLFVALTAISEATLELALQLKKAHEATIPESYDSPAGQCVLRTTLMQENIRATSSMFIKNCIKYLEGKREYTTEHIEILKELKLLDADSHTNKNGTTNERILLTTLAPGMVRLVKQHLVDIANASGFRRSAAYLCLTMMITSSHSYSLKEISWILDSSGEDAFCDAVLLLEPRYEALNNPDMAYYCLEVLCSRSPQKILDVCSHRLGQYSSGMQYPDKAVDNNFMLCMAAALFNNGLWPVLETFLSHPDIFVLRIFWEKALVFAFRHRAPDDLPAPNKFDFAVESVRSLCKAGKREIGSKGFVETIMEHLAPLNALQIQFCTAVWRVLDRADWEHAADLGSMIRMEWNIVKVLTSSAPPREAESLEAFKPFINALNSIAPMDVDVVFELTKPYDARRVLANLIEKKTVKLEDAVSYFLIHAEGVGGKKACIAFIEFYLETNMDLRSKRLWEGKLPKLVDYLVTKLPESAHDALVKFVYRLVFMGLHNGPTLNWGGSSEISKEKLQLMFAVLMEARDEAHQSVIVEMSRIFNKAMKNASKGKLKE